MNDALKGQKICEAYSFLTYSAFPYSGDPSTKYYKPNYFC